MRVLFKVTVSAEDGNRAMADGSAMRVTQGVLEDFPPEAFYAVTMDGGRTMLMVLNLQNESQIVTVTEPLFNAWNARVEVYPVLTLDDVGKGMNAAKKY